LLTNLIGALLLNVMVVGTNPSLAADPPPQPPIVHTAPAPIANPTNLFGVGFTKIGNVSSYCDQGVTASGYLARPGSAGGDYWLPLGSIVNVATYGDVTILDRGVPGIADVDIASPGNCRWSFWWGRRYVRITVLRVGWR
jgi:hypothetical protein